MNLVANRFILCAAILLISNASFVNADNTNENKNLSCFECVKKGLGDKKTGCPQCLPPYLGIRDSSCKRWTESRRESGKTSEQDVAWLFGFVSGYNAYAPGTIERPHATFFYYDESSILENIDRGCSSSPKSSVVEVTVHFLNSFNKYSTAANTPKAHLEFHVSPNQLPELRDMLTQFAKKEAFLAQFNSIKIPPKNERDAFLASLTRNDSIDIELSNLRDENQIDIDVYERKPDPRVNDVVSRLKDVLHARWPDIRSGGK